MRRDGVDVEVGEPFQARELGLVDAAGAAAFGAVVDLGGEDLGEEPQVGLAFPDGDLGQAGGFGADGGQVQFPGGGADRGLGGGVDGRRLRWWWSCSAPGEQFVVVGQGGCRSVVAGQRADRDHRRDVRWCSRRASMSTTCGSSTPRSTARSIAATSAAAGMVRWASRTSISARVPAASPRARRAASQ